jgi:AcrR family transcriptional regulator
MKKQPELTAQTRQNLTDAFWQIYCEKRIEKITVKAITSKAGYNRSTFYEYFTDVNGVLAQIEESLLPGPQGLPPPDLTSISMMSPPLDEFIQMYEKHRKYYRVLFGDNGDPSFQSRMKNTMKLMLKKRLNATGKADDFELDFTLEYMLSAMIGVLSHWSRIEDAPPSDKLLALVYELVHHGVMHKLTG